MNTKGRQSSRPPIWNSVSSPSGHASRMDRALHSNVWYVSPMISGRYCQIVRARLLQWPYQSDSRAYSSVEIVQNPRDSSPVNNFERPAATTHAHQEPMHAQCASCMPPIGGSQPVGTTRFQAFYVQWGRYPHQNLAWQHCQIKMANKICVELGIAAYRIDRGITGRGCVPGWTSSYVRNAIQGKVCAQLCRWSSKPVDSLYRFEVVMFFHRGQQNRGKIEA